MGLNASKVASNSNNKQFPKQPDMEPGTYPARLVQVIDFGLQPQRPYKGEAKAPAHEVGWTYELVDCFMVDEEGKDIEDKPRWVSEVFPFYSLKADRATSTKRIAALDPDNVHNGDLVQMLTTPVLVTIGIEKKGDKTYTNILATTAMRKRDADKCPELVNPTKFFDLTEPNLEVFNSFPDWIKEKIKGNLNYGGSKLQNLVEQGRVPEREKDDAPVQSAAQQAPSVPEAAEDDVPW